MCQAHYLKQDENRTLWYVSLKNRRRRVGLRGGGGEKRLCFVRGAPHESLSRAVLFPLFRLCLIGGLGLRTYCPGAVLSRGSLICRRGLCRFLRLRFLLWSCSWFQELAHVALSFLVCINQSGLAGCVSGFGVGASFHKQF